MNTFKTKGKTLLFLKSKKFNVPNLILVNSNYFLKKKKSVIKEIQRKFKNKRLAIRSSSINEDTSKTSNAGKYKSFLNIYSNNESQISEKILEVIESYKNNNKKNEIIIQEMLKNVKMSGVCTTIDIHNYLPVTTINYHKGYNTEIVTSGKENSYSISVADIKFLDKKNIFYKLLVEVNKLKKIFKNEFLDIEFAFDKLNKLHILQVRELVISKKRKLVNRKFYFQNLKRLEKKILKLKEKNYDLLGNTNYFGVMPDWNPAEIIGSKPRPLALTLYKELITDHVWAEHRDRYGYRNVKMHHLMTSFFGTPFVDVRVDFNSWVPKNLSTKFSNKLVNFYLDKFKKNKFYHDKIEFKIIFSCFTPNTDTRLKKELTNNFTKKEIFEFKKELKGITKVAIKESAEDLKKIENLKIIIDKVSKSKINNISKIYYLIEECKRNGTIAFAGLARCGFIAIDILNSLVDEKILSISEKNKFLNSIKNIATKVNNEHVKLSKAKFCKINGHLRPNTYNITTPNYKEGYNLYFNTRKNFIDKKVKFFFSNKQKNYIKNFLRKNKFNLNIEQFINFLKNSIYSREYSKFIFTKCIDLIFENLISFGNKYKITREELSYLDIGSVINLNDNLDSISIINNLRDKIKNNKIIYKSNSLMHLPEVVTSIKDLYISEKNIMGGNFITQKNIFGKIFELNNIRETNKLENKIVLIESADPGYDFIFSKKIKGLITKYGGQNSHMSIRCSELAIPAAIGVGDEIYNHLKNKKYINLDCLNKKLY